MSNLYFILTTKEITSLTKNRYLKFSYYGKVQNYFIYGRFGGHLDLMRSIDKNNYKMTENGIAFLKEVITTDTDNIFWSMVCLENNVSDESAYLKCLDSLKKGQYESIILNTHFILTHNALYKIK